ncbi:MAG TPA: DNA gyrase subunit A [Firmicutes bacterium]|nr:DNA gyrase subunit A [Bacillota bacterium]
MKKSYLAYSMSVIVGRALPDVRDGLKPVHRRILYTLYERGITPDKPYRKCADTVGAVLGSYHPHGDASVYDALVRLAQDFSLRYPLIDGHGNFGSVDGDPPAAYRYTEARMSKISMEMLTDIEKETIDYMPNYDDRLQEPVMLPSRFPNLLVNGSTGIAVGMATNIPPHNLCEVIDAINLLIENPDAELSEIMEYIKGPDFPTAGIIMGRAGIRSAYATGRGLITLRARAEIEETKNNRFRIAVTELPYMVNKAKLLENIAELVKDKRLDGISDLIDESDRDGMRMVIDLKRDANPQIVLNHLYNLTQMQTTVGVTMLALVNGQPKILTLKECLQEYIKFQEQIIIKRTQFDLRKTREREHIYEGLKIAVDYIDEVIRIIRASKSIADSKINLMERFDLDDVQATAIVQMQLGRLSGMEREKIEEELANLRIKIRELEAILADEGKILQIVRDELDVIRKKFGDERRTEIVSISGEMDVEDLIPDEGIVITLTHYGYIKRQNASVYKTQKRGGRGISGMKQREEDFVKELYICSTHDNLLFITSKGRMFKLKGYEIPEGGRTSKGANMVNLLPLEEDEKVTSMITVRDFNPDQYLVMVTKKGIIKRTELTAYQNIRKNGLIAIKLNEGDVLSWVRMTNGNDDLLIGTRNGMAIRFHENQLRPLSRSATGVRAIRLRGDDEVVGMSCVREGQTVITVTDKGIGRRSLMTDYRLQSRGGYGIRNYKTGEEKGYVCGLDTVDENNDLILISSDGVIIRIRVSDIRIMSRYATGVKVMRLNEDAQVVTFAKTEHEEEEETAQIEEIEGGEEEDLSSAEEDATFAEQTEQTELEEIPEDESEE